MPNSSSPNDLPALLERARARHLAGDLAGAGQLCLEALKQEPRHFAALHQMGLIRLQSGDPAGAAVHLRAAIAVNPRAAETHLHLAHAQLGLGQAQDALASYEQALVLKPDYPEALYGRGNALQMLRRHADAVASYDQALARVPDRPEVLTNRGNALHDLQRYDEALADYDQVLIRMPDVAMLHNNRGNTLRDLQRHAEALASLDRALALEPDYLEARVNRGNVLQDLGRHAEALAEFDRALALSPGAAILHRLRADTLHDLKRHADAVAAYRRALQIDPADPETLSNHAIVLYEIARYDEALVCLDRALALRPEDVKGLNNRIQCLRALHRHGEAAQAITRLLALAPDWDYAQGDLFHARAHCCDWTEHAMSVSRLMHAVRHGRKADTPLAFLAVTDSAAAQLDCARTYAADKFPARMPPLWSGVPRAGDRIRVAYVSADFREHPVSYLMRGVFEQHDRERFEVTGIALSPDDGSPAGRGVRAALGNVVDVFGKTDAEIAALLRGLEIDIVVDLMGHTFGSRTAIFAQRPAPVQVNYLGFPGTMGAPYMDYIIADRVVIPPGQQAYYTEKVVYLPDCFQANDDQRRIGEQPARAAAGLPESAFVFCCFNNSYKITPSVFSRWLGLLRSLPGSVLWLLAEDPAVAKNLRAEAHRQDVDPERLVFAGRVPYADHLARVQLADLFLDTLPFNAGTTASDALWAGVPVLTCCGEAFAARMAASLLTAMDLPELIAGNADDYSAIALRLATTPSALAELRARLSHQRTRSALFDTRRFCRNLESAYLTMWARCCRGEEPAGCEVKPV